MNKSFFKSKLLLLRELYQSEYSQYIELSYIVRTSSLTRKISYYQYKDFIDLCKSRYNSYAELYPYIDMLYLEYLYNNGKVLDNRNNDDFLCKIADGMSNTYELNRNPQSPNRLKNKKKELNKLKKEILRYEMIISISNEGGKWYDRNYEKVDNLYVYKVKDNTYIKTNTPNFLVHLWPDIMGNIIVVTDYPIISVKTIIELHHKGKVYKDNSKMSVKNAYDIFI